MAEKNNKSLSILDDWFYAILLLVIGLLLLMINLGWVSAGLIAYWPVILVIIGLKEILERH